jgi:Protein of unknown function (DUF3592)
MTISPARRWPYLRRDTIWWAGLVAIFLGSMFVLLVWMARQEDLDFQSNGIPVMARVTSKDTRTEIVHRIATTKYVLWYAYEAAGQSHWMGSGDVSYDRWERANVGDDLRIVYLRDRPERSRLAEAADISSQESWLWAGAVVAAVLVISGLILAIYAFSRSGWSAPPGSDGRTYSR